MFLYVKNLKRLFFKIAGFLYFKLWSHGFWTPKDRAYLVGKILPWVSANYTGILFVGVQKYTKDYEKYFLNNQAESIDIDFTQARWGFIKHHFGPIEILKEKNLHYGAIILNGVIGYGLNTQIECEKFIKCCADLLTIHGLLLIGVNPNEIGEVRLDELSSLQVQFRPIAPDRNPQQVRIQNEVFKSIFHDYYFFEKRT